MTTDLADSESFARNGNLEVRLASGPEEIEEAQRLRYRVFYEEMSATPTPEVAAAERDMDEFDAICDHLLVLDHGAPKRADGGPAVVGTYRLLRQEVAERHEGFYTQREFDVAPLIARHPGLRFLELGRSCTHETYRTKPTIELLWHGIMAYVARFGMDVMFGCASLEGTDPDKLALPLSYLFHQHRAPEDWRVRAHESVYVEMDRMPAEDADLRRALRALPPLIKGYVRAGAYIGDGGYIDYQFGTTDVLIIFPVAQINERYRSRFGKEG